MGIPIWRPRERSPPPHRKRALAEASYSRRLPRLDDAGRGGRRSAFEWLYSGGGDSVGRAEESPGPSRGGEPGPGASLLHRRNAIHIRRSRPRRIGSPGPRSSSNYSGNGNGDNGSSHATAAAAAAAASAASAISAMVDAESRRRAWSAASDGGALDYHATSPPPPPPAATRRSIGLSRRYSDDEDDAIPYGYGSGHMSFPRVIAQQFSSRHHHHHHHRPPGQRPQVHFTSPLADTMEPPLAPPPVPPGPARRRQLAEAGIDGRRDLGQHERGRSSDSELARLWPLDRFASILYHRQTSEDGPASSDADSTTPGGGHLTLPPMAAGDEDPECPSSALEQSAHHLLE